MIYKGQELEEWKPIKKEKPFNDLSGHTFGKWYVICRSPNSSGYGLKYWCECLKCHKIYSIWWGNLKNRKSVACSKCCVKEERQLYKNFFPITYYNRLKKEAIQKRKIEFTVSLEYVYKLFMKQDSKCALSGLHIDFFTQTILKTNDTISHHKHTASLDRIDSKKGYINGNVQWVHKDINKMKQSFSQDYFIKSCKLIAENNNG